MKRIIMLAIAMVVFPVMFAMAADQAPQSSLNPEHTAESSKYPPITMYSVAWCPHCRAAKEYLTAHNIPFNNRDVEIDTKAYDELTIKYESTGVPLLVMGSGEKEVVMKGFTPELFEASLKKAQMPK